MAIGEYICDPVACYLIANQCSLAASYGIYNSIVAHVISYIVDKEHSVTTCSQSDISSLLSARLERYGLDLQADPRKFVICLSIMCIIENSTASNEMASVLIDLHRDIDYMYNGFYSLLHYCAMYNNRQITWVLCSRGANVNICHMNTLNNTPLHIAAAYDSNDVADVLLRYGASVDAINDDGKNAIECAATPAFAEYMSRSLF